MRFSPHFHLFYANERLECLWIFWMKYKKDQWCKYIFTAFAHIYKGCQYYWRALYILIIISIFMNMLIYKYIYFTISATLQNPTSPSNAPNNHDINLTINNSSPKVHNPEQTLLIFHIKHLAMFSEDLRALGEHVNEFCASVYWTIIHSPKLSHWSAWLTCGETVQHNVWPLFDTPFSPFKTLLRDNLII